MSRLRARRSALPATQNLGAFAAEVPRDFREQEFHVAAQSSSGQRPRPRPAPRPAGSRSVRRASAPGSTTLRARQQRQRGVGSDIYRCGDHGATSCCSMSSSVRPTCPRLAGEQRCGVSSSACASRVVEVDHVDRGDSTYCAQRHVVVLHRRAEPPHKRPDFTRAAASQAFPDHLRSVALRNMLDQDQVAVSGHLQRLRTAAGIGRVLRVILEPSGSPRARAPTNSSPSKNTMSTPTGGVCAESWRPISSSTATPRRAVVGAGNRQVLVGLVRILIGHRARIPMRAEQNPVAQFGRKHALVSAESHRGPCCHT